MLGDFALQVNHKDNVAVAFREDLKSGDAVAIRDPAGNDKVITIQNDIPFGHKIASVSILKGDPVVKYGEVIGRATQDIRVGEHVHVHNMDSCRGRGDLQKGE